MSIGKLNYVLRVMELCSLGTCLEANDYLPTVKRSFAWSQMIVCLQANEFKNKPRRQTFFLQRYCKSNAKTRKTQSFLFFAEMQRILFKDTANRMQKQEKNQSFLSY